MSLRRESVEYIHLPAGSSLPEVSPSPRRTIVIVEQAVSDDWQDAVSEWIVESGCLYMMAWGRDCSSWDDSVDYANLRQIGSDELTDENHVMTTWHEDEPLSEVFFFNQMCAWHPTMDLPLVTILDINVDDRREKILSAYDDQRASLDIDESEEPRPPGLVDRIKSMWSKQ